MQAGKEEARRGAPRGISVKGAIATVDFFVETGEKKIDRLSLVVGSPERNPSGEGWQCRVALADRMRPETVIGRDSFEALSLALTRARSWIGELQAEGRVLTRDRAGKVPFELP
jgi:hypothetical protein